MQSDVIRYTIGCHLLRNKTSKNATNCYCIERIAVRYFCVQQHSSTLNHGPLPVLITPFSVAGFIMISEWSNLVNHLHKTCHLLRNGTLENAKKTTAAWKHSSTSLCAQWQTST